MLKLRMPPYVRIVLENRVPAQPHHHSPDARGLLFRAVPRARFRRAFRTAVSGPVPNAPLPGRPGAFAGTSGMHCTARWAMCLRPCQQAVSAEEYAHEVARVTEFLATGGRSVLDAIAHSRDRLSEEMAFEEAARLHKRFEKVQEVLKLRDELARDLDRLNGVAITRSLAARRGGVVVRARRLSAAAGAASASKWRKARPSRSTANCARHSPARRRVKLAVRENARNNWRCWRAGVIRAGATASGWASTRTTTSRTAGWCMRSRAWPAANRAGPEAGPTNCMLHRTSAMASLTEATRGHKMSSRGLCERG